MYKQRRDWQRQTWLPQLQFDHKFFIGLGTDAVEEDVVVLGCKDDYNSLPEKTIGVIGWAREHGYDRLLKIDDDVYIRPERLVVPDHDYVGHTDQNRKYPSGAAYWLSSSAMDACLGHWYRRNNAEDWCVGYSLERAGITLVDDHRYRIGWKSFKKNEGENEFPHPDNDTITFHMYFPNRMVQMHQDWDKKKQLVTVHSYYGADTR